jgi:hypothetical protein
LFGAFGYGGGDFFCRWAGQWSLRFFVIEIEDGEGNFADAAKREIAT